MIKAVLFDMDGTVLDTETVHKIAWDRALTEASVPIAEDTFYSLIGLNVQSTGQYLKEHFGLEEDAFLQVNSNAVRYSYEYIEQKGLSVKKGFHALSDFLLQNGIKSVIVTSSEQEDARANLGKAGILDRFDGIIGGGDVEKGKPSPEPYLKAAALVGLSPSECIAAEDSANGVRSAYNAGITCVYIKDMIDIPQEVQALAAYHEESLDKIIKIIEKENKSCHTSE